jgi:hypothetical protein
VQPAAGAGGACWEGPHGTAAAAAA